MNGQTITWWFVTALVLVGIVYDVWIYQTHGSASTISWTVWCAAKEYPVIPFAMGILCGHLFWVQQTGMMFPWTKK